MLKGVFITMIAYFIIYYSLRHQKIKSLFVDVLAQKGWKQTFLFLAAVFGIYHE